MRPSKSLVQDQPRHEGCLRGSLLRAIADEPLGTPCPLQVKDVAGHVATPTEPFDQPLCFGSIEREQDIGVIARLSLAQFKPVGGHPRFPLHLNEFVLEGSDERSDFPLCPAAVGHDRVPKLQPETIEPMRGFRSKPDLPRAQSPAACDGWQAVLPVGTPLSTRTLSTDKGGPWRLTGQRGRFGFWLRPLRPRETVWRSVQIARDHDYADTCWPAGVSAVLRSGPLMREAAQASRSPGR